MNACVGAGAAAGALRKGLAAAAAGGVAVLGKLLGAGVDMPIHGQEDERRDERECWGVGHT